VGPWIQDRLTGRSRTCLHRRRLIARAAYARCRSSRGVSTDGSWTATTRPSLAGRSSSALPAICRQTPAGSCATCSTSWASPLTSSRRASARYREAAGSPRLGWLRAPSDLQKKLIRQPGLRSAWRRLSPSLQQRVIRLLREANYRFDLWNRRGAGPSPIVPSAETLAALRTHYEGDRPLLEELIGRPVPWASGDRIDHVSAARG
jgi:hypothetical protein